MEPSSPSRWTTFIGLHLATTSPALVLAIALVWPLPKPYFELATDLRYLLLAAAAGALGSMVHLATSFTHHTGQKTFQDSWVWWYLLRPLIGLALALFMYFLMRASLVGATTSAESLNPYGIAAFSGLCGLFSRQAMDKLRETFEHLCRTAKRDPR